MCRPPPGQAMEANSNISVLDDSRARRELENLDGACCLLGRDWTEDEFLILDQSQEPHHFEFTDGSVEFFGWPDWIEAGILGDLSILIDRHLREQKLGRSIGGVCPIRLRPGRWASPDLSIHLNHRWKHFADPRGYMHGADAVIEILSDDPYWRAFDLIRKRQEYAEAGIREYWTVDYQVDVITVLALHGNEYNLVGEYGRGQSVVSHLMPDLRLDVSTAFEKADYFRERFAEQKR